MADPYKYYNELIEAAQGVGDEEERRLMIANGIEELVERKEVETTSRDMAGSRIVQKLIELAPLDGEALALLAEQFAGNWFALATDKFSSYVLEDYLKRLSTLPASKLANNQAFGKFFRVVCKVTRLNMDECLPHARASHVIRGLICALAAVRCFPKGIGDDAVRLLSPGISLEHRKRLVTLACCMASSKVVTRTSLFSRLCNEYAAPVFCMLLKVSKYRFPEEFRLDFCKTLAKCIYSERKSAEDVCSDEVLSHVVNDLILATPPSSDLFRKLLRRYLSIGKTDEKERIAAMAVDPLGNYCVQTTLRALTSQDEFPTFSESILSSMTAIFNTGCLGVITQMVRAASRLLSPSSGVPPFSAKLHSELSRVLSCKETERTAMLVPCLFFYLPYDHLPKSFDDVVERPSPSLPGCLLLEALFNLPDPSAYVDSLVTAPGFVTMIASTAEGYHVLSQVFSAKTVPACSKAEIVASLAPLQASTSRLCSLASTHFGCLTYKAIWDALPDQRSKLAQYLSQYPDAMRESKYGRFLWAAFSLRLYSVNPKRWVILKQAPDVKPISIGRGNNDRFEKQKGNFHTGNYQNNSKSGFKRNADNSNNNNKKNRNSNNQHWKEDKRRKNTVFDKKD